jgi:hypothetical protein
VIGLLAVVVGQLAWAAGTLLRDEAAFADAFHGVLVREPVRSEVAEDLTEDLAAGAIEVLGERATPALRADLAEVEGRVAASPAVEEDLEAIARWAASGVVGDGSLPPPELSATWEAYLAEVTVLHPDVGRELRRAAADAPTADELDVGGGGEGLRLGEGLVWLVPVPFVAFLVAFGAVIAGVLGGRSRGRGVALLIAVPAVATVVVAALGDSASIALHLLGAVARAALPAAVVTGAVALAALVAGSRVAPVDRSRVAAAEVPEGWLGPGGPDQPRR